MIYIDGDSCLHGAGIAQELFGYTEYYTGVEIKERIRKQDVRNVNNRMIKMKEQNKNLATSDSKFIENNNVSAQLIKKGINVKTKARGGSSNQAIASRIIDAIISDSTKTVIFCPTNCTRLIYPRKNSQSLTFGNADISKEYKNYIKKWLKVFSVEQTRYLELNALLGLMSFCKDNNIELLGVKTLIWQLQVNDVKKQSTDTLFTPIFRIIDQVNELCIFDMGSDFLDNEKKLYTACGHPNLQAHTKLAEDICTHLKI
tara:strand:+ start:334 stop:1107 length:774 start_codon:yes stop_codon:yes gene_type:complete